jgi:hypothetical protein
MEGCGSVGVAAECGIGIWRMAKVECGLQLLAFFTANPQIASRWNALAEIVAATLGDCPCSATVRSND